MLAKQLQSRLLTSEDAVRPCILGCACVSFSLLLLAGCSNDSGQPVDVGVSAELGIPDLSLEAGAPDQASPDGMPDSTVAEGGPDGPAPDAEFGKAPLS